MEPFVKLGKNLFIKNKNHIIYDAHWQYPAITEKAVNQSILNFDISSSDYIYIAFPWATFLDLTRRGLFKTEKYNDLRKSLILIKDCLSQINYSNYSKVISCCQHIHLTEHIKLFNDLSITDLFWSHKTKSENEICGINLHPLPLYPVHSSKKLTTPFISEENLKNFFSSRKYLTSFVGADKHPGYL